jgi:hypothetical protein
MRLNSRLDKAVKGLHQLVQRHNLQDNFQISKNIISINNTTPQLWGTIFYIVVCILLPAGLLIYYLVADNSNSTIFWLLLLELLLVYDLYKIVRGNTLLTIDFTSKQLLINNINGVFKSWFLPKSISFDEIANTELKEISIYSKYSRTTWLQLIATDKAKHKIILTDMSKNYPVSYVAKKVKFLIDVIIWTAKQNANSAVSQY